MTRHGAVVVGGYVNGLGVVRALADLGAEIAVVRTEPFDIAHASRWCSESIDLGGSARFDDALFDALSCNRERWHGRVVFPTNDSALLALARLRDLLPEYTIVAPPLEVAGTLLDKRRLDEHAREVGLDLPYDYGRADGESSKREDLRFPIVVKPIESHSFAARFGAKLFLANTRAELARAVRRVEEAGLEARLLELVPGGDDAFYNYCVYIDHDDVVVTGLGMHKLRKSPPFFGVCRVAEPWPDERLREPTVALLHRIGYRGMANAEFKLDPRDGKMRFMEVNGRPFLMAGLARCAGVDLVRLAWAEKLGLPLPAARYNGWRGHWIHAHADLLYALLFHRAERLGLRAFARPYLGAKAFAVWSARDPAPFALQWARTLRDGGRAAIDRRRNAEIRERVQIPDR